MIRPVLIWPSVRLESRCETIDEAHLDLLREGDAECWLKALVTDLVETLACFGGSGLSAPQIGELVNVIAIRVKHSQPEGKADVEEIIPIVNPSLKLLGRSTIVAEERCLSFPNHAVKIKRARDVALCGVGLDGHTIEIEGDGALAISIQHEMDHLAGIVLTDYESQLKRDLVRVKLAKLKIKGLQYRVPTERQST
jgi:peptide deformylase